MTEPSSGRPAIVPGRLRNFVEMTIQTRQAQRLIRGRRGIDGKPHIVGLYRYGAMTRIIWTGASHDDPYADWRLLQIEQCLTEAKEELVALRKNVDDDLARVAAMKVGLAHSLEPAKIELTFSNPYGYMGAWLLADMDELALATLTARHVGLITRDDAEGMLSEAGRTIRRTFASAQGYKATAVKREDVRQGTRRADRAKQIMGELPQAVIDGELRAEHAPLIEGLQQSSPKTGPDADSTEDTTDEVAAAMPVHDDKQDDNDQAET